ncbi:GNAT family protein [Streptomyces sp. ActVer]|uniref:GNAT family N-acetyltransferase n=1 Tax=Streptomyces sp. ActVer TaxID=3014558 RepID=UPI0022B3CA52|nr:GNAT family protein [Streptomyces sp. ActVer]MCZ4514575.1 GNAT family protein [Streptomyces sp. ActVer]
MSRRWVTLDKIASEDWSAIHSWACRSEACWYQAWGPNTEAQTQEFVAGAVRAWSDTPQCRFPFVARLAGNVVGMGELFVRSRVQRQGEITYIVHPQVWGQGIGTQIGRQLLAYGFGELGLHRIHATCDPRNVGSSQVLAKLGMTHEGSLRHTQLIRDGWRDSLIFSVLEDEWSSAAQGTPSARNC